jgi:hypothetical protein
MAKAKNLPKEILVYVCDTLDDGTPVYAVADSVDDISEEFDGQVVGNYYLDNKQKFGVKRTLT